MFWTLYIFLLCCWSFSSLFLRAFFILSVTLAANVFSQVVLYVLIYLWWYLLPFKSLFNFMYFILCFLVMASLCWVRVRKTFPTSRFLSSFWYFYNFIFSIYILVHLVFILDYVLRFAAKFIYFQNSIVPTPFMKTQCMFSCRHLC